MEPVLSSLTLEKLYESTRSRQIPVPEVLAFHIVAQTFEACLFLHESCELVRMDSNRENILLRYPGRQIPQLPDVVIIDWSLWDEANADRTRKDSKAVCDLMLPVLFHGGWKCGTEHSTRCAPLLRPHSQEWLHLWDDMCGERPEFSRLAEYVAAATRESRRLVVTEREMADRVQALLDTTETRFAESRL